MPLDDECKKIIGLEMTRLEYNALAGEFFEAIGLPCQRFHPVLKGICFRMFFKVDGERAKTRRANEK